MCGLTGFWSPAGLDRDAADVLRRMSDCLRHRGPDDEGTELDAEAGLALGFRRLAIVELSPLGHQPMTSASGRYVVAFNGEIYNFRELRADLARAGAAFRGQSDTEVLLAAVERWGMRDAATRFVGMFAIALFDRRARTLTLVRDRVGEKPLYFGHAGASLVFGSELKSLRRHPAFDATIDRAALALFMRHGYVPAPYSIYRGIRKVVPGTLVTFDAAGAESVETYWSAAEAAARGLADPLVGSEDELADACEAVLRRTIRDEMVADVPLGAFLSGGIDSSLVVALMQSESARPVRTFTIGFHEREYDEARHARAVADRLGTEHTAQYVSASDAIDVVPRLPHIFDEPFADASQIPTYLVAQLARRHVTVSLSGDGGDELFGGYNRYLYADRVGRWLGRVPRSLRRASAWALRSVPPARWDALVGAASAAIPARYRVRAPGDRAHKLATVLGTDDVDEVYRALVSRWSDDWPIVRDAADLPTWVSEGAGALALGGAVPRMMYLDLVSYLPDDLMVKVDRATMAVSLESRAPYLDHRVVEFAWRLPLAAKIHGGVGKRVLRRVLDRFVPRALIERPKTGFEMPLDQWLRGPLREWADALLAPERLRREGFFRVDAVERRWREHTRGVRNWQHDLWNVLMFQSWNDAR